MRFGIHLGQQHLPGESAFERFKEHVEQVRLLRDLGFDSIWAGQHYLAYPLQFLQTGATDAGIVALSVANVPEIDWVAIDPALHAPLNQVVAVVRKSGRPELGVAFIQFIGGPEGRRIMKSYGFLLPGEF